MSYTSAATSAAQIRLDFKNKGWGRGMISVRAHSYSMGSSIRVTIKDPSIPYHVAKEIAEQEERIRRDERTHEILAGGNRYVSVNTDRPTTEAKAAPYLDRVIKAMAEFGDPVEAAKNDRRDLVTILSGFHLGAADNGAFSLWGPDHYLAQWWNAAGVSQQIAYRIALEVERMEWSADGARIANG